MVYIRTLVATGLGILLMFLTGCQTGDESTVFYVNSYHKGYAPSDGVMAGIKETLADSDVRLRTFFMDSKRHPEPESVQSKAAEALDLIEQIQPDVIIASDDNAVRYVVAGRFRHGPIPCVFCGVNWTCEQYGLPTDNITGMLEVPPVRETLRTLREYYPDARTLTVLSGNTTSEQTNRAILAPVFDDQGVTASYILVDTYEQWRMEFLKTTMRSDLIFLPTSGAIKNWDAGRARAFVKGHIRVPVFTCDAFMMEYAVFGLTTVAAEQGRWAATTALEMLRGKRPGEIPVTRTRQTQAYVNMDLAKRIGFSPDAELLNRCRRIE